MGRPKPVRTDAFPVPPNEPSGNRSLAIEELLLLGGIPQKVRKLRQPGGEGGRSGGGANSLACNRMGVRKVASSPLRRAATTLLALVVALASVPGLGASGEAGELRVLHITDVHLDLQYEAGSNALCARPPCCRPPSSRKGQRKLAEGVGTDEKAVSGAPVRPEKPTMVENDDSVAGKLGSRNCDSPLALLQSALSAARSVDPDIVVWTGDTLPHRSDKDGTEPGAGREEALRVLANATGAFRTALSGYFDESGLDPEPLRGRVFPVLGNHDFRPAHTDPGPGRRAWLTGSLADGPWGDLLGSDEARRTFTHGGFYKAPVRARGMGSGAYVIGLNTEVCHVRNYHAFGDETSAEEQLRWLRLTLADLRADGGKAILIGHIPPGLWSGCWGEYSEEYENIVGSFEDVVAAQLYGHHHSGSLRVLHGADGEGAASGVAYVTPSLTPFRNQLPSFRVYTVSLGGGGEGTAGEGTPSPAAPPVTKFTQYFLDLSKYRAPSEADVVAWYVSYTAPDSLGIPDLAPKTWRLVADRLLSNKTIRDDYVRLEANGREGAFMGTERQLLTLPCGMRHVGNSGLMECAKQNEEQFIRDYTGKEHTYVLTTMFSFDVLMDEFCTSLEGFLPSDCAITESPFVG